MAATEVHQWQVWAVLPQQLAADGTMDCKEQGPSQEPEVGPD